MFNVKSVDHCELMLPESMEGFSKPIELVSKVVESVSESVQCSAVTRSQAKAELNYRVLNQLIPTEHL